MKRRTLYLPIGTKCRELPGKTLLAAKAVERGWRVVIGGLDMRAELLEESPPGLLVENNVPDDKADRFRRLKDRGYVIANLSEESALYRDAEEYWTHRIGTRALESTDVVFTVGVRSEEDIRVHRQAAAGRMVRTGNPRFDTLLPGVRTVYDADAGAIRRRHGRFLLVNSNFGPANPYKMGLDVVAAWRRDGKLTTPEQIDRKRREIAYKTRQMIDLQALLATVAAAGAFERIVVRPHPTENHDAWRAWASAVNVDVEYEGSAIPWILAAEMMLHAGCTTAIEALLLDRPTVSFVPRPDSEFVTHADAVSVQVANADELLALVEKGWERSGEWRRSHLARGKSIISPYVANVEPPLAADRLLDAADRLAVPETAETKQGPLERLAGALRPAGRAQRRAAAKEARQRYRSQMFPGLAPEDVRAPVAHWIASGVVGRMPRMLRMGSSVLQLQ